MSDNAASLGDMWASNPNASKFDFAEKLAAFRNACVEWGHAKGDDRFNRIEMIERELHEAWVRIVFRFDRSVVLTDDERSVLAWVVRTAELDARGEDLGECNASEARQFKRVASVVYGLLARTGSAEGHRCDKCGAEDNPVYGCACGCDFSVLYCQGCGAAPHVDGTRCPPACRVQLYPVDHE